MEILGFLFCILFGMWFLFLPDRLAAMLFIVAQIRINKELKELMEEQESK